MPPLRDAIARWLEGVDVFIQNPAACSGVDLLRAWLLAAFICILVRLVATSVAASRRISSAVPARDERMQRIYGDAAALAGVAVPPPLHRAAPAEPAAFTAGFRRQAVFATERLAALSDEQLRVVFVHELTHVKRLDNLRGWWWNSVTVLAPVLFAAGFLLYDGFVARLFRFDDRDALWTLAGLTGWLIAVQPILSRQLTLAREISCDAACARIAGSTELVARTILAVLRLQHGGAARPVAAASGLARRDTVRARIETLLNRRTRLVRSFATATFQLSVASLLAMVLWTAMHRA